VRAAEQSATLALSRSVAAAIQTDSQATRLNGDDSMSEAEKLFGDEHVRRYRETGGEVGHLWREGSTILLLTTTGRKSGEKRTAPLIYAQDGARYIIIASKGGAPEDPGWYENIQKTPVVELQVKGEVFRAKAHTATGEERTRLWRLANMVWPHYEEYAKKTTREIPVVVLERA
jgi:deazaflavin-dependent oxidoreductase (nitroreductase family)